MTNPVDPKRHPLFFKVLGRTLEHFGVQMYKRREIAIAELVANCWDAGALEVFIEIPQPDEYSADKSMITLRDTGCGMGFEEVKNAYLVLGRNRRHEGVEIQACLPFEELKEQKKVDERPEPVKRRVMGRKGIGKLAGFGLARKMTVTTWRKGEGIEFYLDLAKLKLEDNTSQDVEIEWKNVPPRTDLSPSGTIVTLQLLKHNSPIEIEPVKLSLARRFSRTIRGQMTIKVNGDDLPDPTPPLDKRFPEKDGDFLFHKFPDGTEVRYWYGFATDTIKNKELRGFAVLANGKVAQTPPFFFDVEATASGQHSTKYVVGDIEADFLDAGEEDETDRISTDRQEIDWEDDSVKGLKEWGKQLSYKVLSDCRDFRGEKTEQQIMSDPAFGRRIGVLDPQSQKQISQFLKVLGHRDDDDGRTNDLADSLVRAYEFRQFHDVIEEIENAAEDPERLATFLRYLGEWKVLESRAILEIIQGRIDIIERFEKLIVENAPETAHRKGDSNMHDAIARFPWLLNPEWQVLSEEKTITKQLREWNAEELNDKPEDAERYDFLALADAVQLVVIEIKRSGHPVSLEELQRLVRYKERLSKSRPNIRMVMIYGGTVDVSDSEKRIWENNPDRELRPWSHIFQKSRNQYERHRALLRSDVEHPDFSLAKREIAETRQVIETGSTYRERDERRKGLGPQDSTPEAPPKIPVLKKPSNLKK